MMNKIYDMYILKHTTTTKHASCQTCGGINVGESQFL